MKKNIWIWNHYATGMFNNRGGRHYWFAENLIKKGYKPTIFCANTYHNSPSIIEVGNKKYAADVADGIPFVFVKTSPYSGNGIKRIKNMVGFYKNLFSVSKEYSRIYGKPNVILASSVHPLTLVAGIKIAKEFGIPCICEVRDLWPESLVAYKIVKENNPILKLLYVGERWIYKKADKLVFTVEGGKDYIIDKGWDKEHGGPIDINKVYHINNGVDLEEFNYNKEHYILDDKDLKDKTTFKVVYAGSIRRVNNLSIILETAKLIKNPKIKFLIWGDGDEMVFLQRRCQDEGISNLVFKGRVDKKFIPYILSHADANLLHFEATSIMRYGMSANKLFDYFAAKKPIVSDVKTNYDLILKYNLGVVAEDQTPEKIKEAIERVSNMTTKERIVLKDNLHRAALDYDFKNLTDKLINIIG